ncbi:KPN_02809 family neutral zinc metallopeptidase [Virgisporangium aurantiacum]|uniref:Membrane protein n=1 Tax=Virgisporangium aurantiacum TaxID=175570 RepID=A0A8J3ZC83_9ACTN|nr:neutral zinc metallopeptidase [Virgisporangium aurantiacum]GIJ58986.1 membrane protein [Virgisporangium aurantiacum]
MELNENANLDTGQVEDLRGSGGGGGRTGGGGIPIPLPSGGGGWVGLIVTAVLVIGGAIFGGVNVLGGDGGGNQQGDNTNLEQKCATSNPNRFQEVDCRNLLYVNSVQAYWRVALPQVFGKQYQPAETNFFSNQVSTGCGAADSGVGPFYCPPDREVYIDLTFYNELSQRFGAEGEFAAPYVIAHEYGHHVQNLLGTSDEVSRQEQRDPNNANKYSVMLELQADCYAGVWAKFATTTTDAGGQALFKSITEADISQAVETAEAIGDDAIQKKAGGGVNPDKFTHGTSAQRKQWFLTGYQGGDPKRCDTFTAGV